MKWIEVGSWVCLEHFFLPPNFSIHSLASALAVAKGVSTVRTPLSAIFTSLCGLSLLSVESDSILRTTPWRGKLEESCCFSSFCLFHYLLLYTEVTSSKMHLGKTSNSVHVTRKSEIHQSLSIYRAWQYRAKIRAAYIIQRFVQKQVCASTKFFWTFTKSNS